MPPSSDLLGREALVRQVTDSLRAGRSVLLFGPEGIGKSAIIAAATREDVVVVDPLEHMTPRQAARGRRALDRGVVHLAASRVARGRQLGAVGRIMWRFSTVRVRELPDAIIQRIVTREMLRRADADAKPETAWVHEIATLAQGRPGFATAMVRFAAQWRCHHGYLPMPELAFAATREDATIRTLRTVGHAAGQSPGTSKVHS
jgi:hypothetical protein